LDLVGQTLAGHYVVDSHLGEGGMGSVFRARDTELFDRSVVIKVPHASMLETPLVRERFVSEMRSLARVEHPHIIKILGAGEHEGVPFAVVQYVGGGDLRDRVPPGEHVPPQEILGWLPAVAGALDFVHREGLCHRDVKPANIFFDEHGNAFLSDFGIATAMQRHDPQATQLPSKTELTMGGTFIGSPAYAPPESIVRDISPAYDQYSLAVTVYEMLTGQLPYEQSGQAALMAKNMDPPTPIGELAPELPQAAADAVMQALATRARDRHENCSAFAEAFASGLSASAPAAAAAAGGSRVIGALAALGAAASVALLAWALWQNARAPADAGGEPEAPPTGSAAVAFLAGSTPAELRRAKDLCLQNAGDASASQLDCEPAALGDAVAHQVELRPFSLDREEVTNAQFAEFVERTGYTTEAERRGYSWHRNVESPGRSWRQPMGPESSYRDLPEHPVVHVSLADAEAFCQSVGARLPAEEEWEFAARGSGRRIFPWGNRFDEASANWNGSDVDGLQDVGAHPFGETPQRSEDMAGNAAEWTSTRVEGDVVIKGGSWIDRTPAALRGAARQIESPDNTRSDVGFRCVRDVPEWPSS
jgi:formylglycine-generating enzyme required for sulfatase activity/tRNA A-37 threonylcarbamoyl transferase component Bud32